MATTAIPATPSTTNLTPATPIDPTQPVGKKTLDENDFMKLFITQLQFQDPMKPMDSNEMASQMAQFSTMDATMKMSDDMEKLLNYQVSQNNLQLLTLLGNTVQTSGSQIAVSGGTASATEFTLPDSTQACNVEIYDNANHLVRTYYKGPTNAGTYPLSWDGKDGAGQQVADGIYSYVVKAADASGQDMKVDYRTTGKVTGVEFDSGQAKVKVDNFIDVAVSDITQVSGGASGTTSTTTATK